MPLSILLRDERAPATRLTYAALTAACLLWGTTFYLGKIALLELTAVELTAWRFGLAAPLLAVVLLRAGRRLTRRDAVLIVVTGVLCVPVGFVVHFEGLARTSATHAALLVGIGPPLLAAAAAVLRIERIARKDWVAVVLSCVGVVVMVGTPGSGGDPLGNGLIILSMIVVTAWVLLSQRLTRRLGATVATAWILLTGTAALLPVLAIYGAPPVDLSPRVWASLAALSLGCTIGAFTLWNWGAGRLPAGRAGVFLNLEPVTGALLGVGLLGDPAGASALLGGGIVLVAALLVTVETRRPRRRPAASAVALDHFPQPRDRPPVAGGGGHAEERFCAAGELRAAEPVGGVQIEHAIAEPDTLGR